MAKNYRKNKIFIPNTVKFPKLANQKRAKRVNRVVEKKQPLDDVILENSGIDAKRLAMLINICHAVADVNERLSMEISEILKVADPTLELQFQRSIRQIRNHAADMVRFVDTHTSPEFSEGFGEVADALMEVIMNFFRVQEQ
ncbi:hypothetical protein [Dysgonomonas sp. 25]|uniref:hypothetical protein n=1 Tax=Dysgonomonas sp. 25 TaxID=2302933 RepID=UPI0013D6A974|nr:hypothetical protein [Dysgonomonas sp. 25]NDV68577.1 hypothetical protein [Dysgonomonas sp. 25]